MKQTIIAALIILPAVAGGAGGEEDSAKPARLAAENNALKARLAESSKQIETLTQQLVHLRAVVDNLKKEVTSLKAANAELKAQLARKAPRSAGPVKPQDPAGTKLVISVQPGGWGGAGVQDIQKLLLSAGSELWKHFPGRRLRPIIVRHSDSGPIVLFRQGPAGEYIVKLDVEGTYWAQFTYQFSHELCHILTNYEKKTSRKNKWFEESLCEMASMFALRRMAVTWRTSPPYPHWKSFAPALRKYADDLQAKKERQLPQGTTLAKWYRDNEQGLRKNPTLRSKNGVVANELLGLFEAGPESWAAVGYLNMETLDDSDTFKSYLESWHRHCPAKHKEFVRQIGDLFEIKISSPAKQK